MRKARFRIITFSLLFAGLGIMIGSMYAKEEKTKTIMLSVTGLFYLAAAVQIFVFRKKEKDNSNG